MDTGCLYLQGDVIGKRPSPKGSLWFVFGVWTHGKLWVCVQGRGKESCGGCHNYVPRESPLKKKVDIDGPTRKVPDVKPRRILSRMTWQSKVMNVSTLHMEKIDDIKVLDHHSTRRPYKALMIESLGKRELWKVPMSKGTRASFWVKKNLELVPD